ncbi:MAG: hypothetical protein ACJ8AT_21550 [Hyalangium sp.]|uniref:hypothetical protein n=1 Tax=Hyalangium sp. TaxID=2028555 RepID=UPI00389A5294
MRPIRVEKAEESSSAPTVPMRPIRVGKAEESSSAPTVPMRPIRLPVTEDVKEKVTSTPVRDPERAPKVPPSPAELHRPAPRTTPVPAAPGVQKPPGVAAVESPGSSPRTGGTGPRPAVVQNLPAPQRPVAAPAEEPRPAPKQKPAADDAPRKPGLSTSVMLRANKLNKLLEQSGRDKGASEQLLVAAVQSYPGQRTVSQTQDVINQYAVATHPRYAPRAVEPREAGHLFVFDVMNSLHTTLEHAFPAGAPGLFRPGTPAELWKWLNETAPSRGWRVVAGSALMEATARGLPVIAMADTPVGPRFAVVEPGPLGPDGKLRLASAYAPRGQQQAPEQIFGSSAVRYLAHD